MFHAGEHALQRHDIRQSDLEIDFHAATSTVTVSLDGLNAPGFDPTFYLSGGICDVIQCDGTAPLPDLPAGSYCSTVTASPFDAVGECGCFTMYVITALPDRLFDDGFDVVTARAVVDIQRNGHR